MQIGILLGLPVALSTLLEPALMLLGDTRVRKHLVIAGLIGWTAGLAGLQTAMWLLLLGPLCLVAFVPRPASRGQVVKLNEN